MKIAIVFSDNDFGKCFTGVLETLLSAKKWYGKLPEDKEKLCAIINEISTGIYLLYQNQFKYSNFDTMDNHIEHIREYLKITPNKILLNEEVVEYLKNDTFGNSETFILDTDLDYPNNSPIYCL